MFAEHDNCSTDLLNKTKVGLHSKEDVPCVWPGQWKWNSVFKKNGGLAEQDNFNNNSTKETNVGLWLKKKKEKKKGGVFCAIKPQGVKQSIV